MIEFDPSGGGFLMNSEFAHRVFEIACRPMRIKKRLRPGSKWLKKSVKRYRPFIEIG